MKIDRLLPISLLVLSFVMSACQKDEIIPPEEEKTPISNEILWTVIQQDRNLAFQTIHFDPSGMFGMAYSGDGRGYSTHDAGKTWRAFNLTQWLDQSGGFSYATIADTKMAWMNAYDIHGSRMFFGSTEDAGNTWTFKEFPYTRTFQIPAAIRPSNKAIYVFESASLPFEWSPWYRKRSMFVSLDGGASWGQRSLADYILAVAPVTASTIMVAAASDSTRYAISSLFISSDNGATWKPSLTDSLWYFHGIHFATSTQGIAVAARYRTDMDSSRLAQAVFRTLDGGITWKKTYELSVPWRGKDYASRTTAGILFAAPPVWVLDISYSFTGSGGLNIDRYRSDDNGLNWAYLENLRGYYYEPAFAPPDWKVGIRGNQMTQDGGRTWHVKSWLITRAFFTSPYQVFAVKDSLILRGTAP